MNLKRNITKQLLILSVCTSAVAREYHVSPSGNDSNVGTASAMLRTISAAAQKAQPGDTVMVHAGTYRERIDPPRSGMSDHQRIVYQAAKGETVTIKGSERVTGWKKVQGDTWEISISNKRFGSFNPFSDEIHGDWFKSKGRKHHTGAVYLNGHWLTEAATRDKVSQPAGKNPLWFAQVNASNTVILAQFPEVDPNREQTEVNARRAVFYPSRPGINYITLRGFVLEQAATPWAPPTAEQIGLVGTHWS
jgi:alpha-N-arabinofuranosidase